MSGPGPTSTPALSADYYDGHSARRHRVTLTLEGQWVSVIGENIERRAHATELRVSEPMGAAPRLITFADGAFCEVRDHAALKALLVQSGHRDRFVVRWQYSLRWVAAAVLTLVALTFGAYRYGFPWLAEAAAKHVPHSAVKSLSDHALAQLDGLAEPSRLPAQRRNAISTRFQRLAVPAGAPASHGIVFRHSDILGANALALPSGVIVLFDELVTLARDDEEILGVLAHELGHIQANHGLRLVLQTSLVGLASAWYIGDISSTLASASVILLHASYSRAFEREADEFARQMMLTNGIPPDRLADLLERMEEAHAGRGGGSAAPEYLSSHPATTDRLRYLREP